MFIGTHVVLMSCEKECDVVVCDTYLLTCHQVSSQGWKYCRTQWRHYYQRKTAQTDKIETETVWPIVHCWSDDCFCSSFCELRCFLYSVPTFNLYFFHCWDPTRCGSNVTCLRLLSYLTTSWQTVFWLGRCNTSLRLLR